ncbi:thiazole-adenylate synthase [Desulfacinum infernum DSM 9756]|uniref:Thiamine thiazole synthase n=1 Tax=Desulfacinum infernum DSM 9756 TaxID=1121391 RepID=A0A1M5HL12_9BACT|nr:sulfide-dependent adenosine diphosphate thiazole synthase [Desulfacinum infernum]SHG16655.1 thiazole-adenylate synthase [Desulfacinum infernum DSM 9756]
MGLDERIITRAIVDRYFHKLKAAIDLDVAIVGAGPSGLVAGMLLAEAGTRVALFERKLSVGGGMWGGGMLFNEIVVQEEAKAVLDRVGITAQLYQEGYYTADAVEAVSTLTSRCVKAGARIFNGVSIEDVLMRPERIMGLVLNWSAVEMAGLHVDPLAVRCRVVVDATGHDTEVVKVVERKVPGSLLTPSGKREGERSMWAEEAERLTLENTREVYPGLYVAGMAANATFGGPRMGPVFGGMLLSGRKVARLILEQLKS